MIQHGKKRGLSPTVATVLLISIALILAIIIFIWARGFIGETLLKADEPIENSCEQVIFSAEAFANGGEISLVNQGNIPIYEVAVYKPALFGTSEIDTLSGSGNDNLMLAGTTVTEYIGDDSIEVEDELILTPIILGEDGDERKPYLCDRDLHGIRIEVK